jgi:hypothetical protein
MLPRRQSVRGKCPRTSVSRCSPVREGPLLQSATGSKGSIALVQFVGQRPFAQAFVPPGGPDLCTSALGNSSRRLRRPPTSVVHPRPGIPDMRLSAGELPELAGQRPSSLNASGLIVEGRSRTKPVGPCSGSPTIDQAVAEAHRCKSALYGNRQPASVSETFKATDACRFIWELCTTPAARTPCVKLDPVAR